MRQAAVKAGLEPAPEAPLDWALRLICAPWAPSLGEHHALLEQREGAELAPCLFEDREPTSV
jgi:hypothetical protein